MMKVWATFAAVGLMAAGTTSSMLEPPSNWHTESVLTPSTGIIHHQIRYPAGDADFIMMCREAGGPILARVNPARALDPRGKWYAVHYRVNNARAMPWIRWTAEHGSAVVDNADYMAGLIRDLSQSRTLDVHTQDYNGDISTVPLVTQGFTLALAWLKERCAGATHETMKVLFQEKSRCWHQVFCLENQAPDSR
jgi:hypothetical protein